MEFLYNQNEQLSKGVLFMKPSHRKDVILARLVFVAFCAIVIAIVVVAVSKITAGHKAKVASQQKENEDTQTVAMWEIQQDTEAVEIDTEYMVDAVTYVETTASVNLRSEPSTDADSLGILPAGTEMQLNSENDGWAEVSYNGTVGYVSTEYIKQTSIVAAGTDGETTGETVTLKTNDAVNMRSGPGTDYDKVTLVPAGTEVEKLGDSGDWTQVSYNGSTGYIRSDFLDEN